MKNEVQWLVLVSVWYYMILHSIAWQIASGNACKSVAWFCPVRTESYSVVPVDLCNTAYIYYIYFYGQNFLNYEKVGCHLVGMYLAFRREDMEDKMIKREDDRKRGWWRWSSFLPLPPQLMTGLISLTVPRTQKINSTILYSLTELPAYISSQPDVKAH